MTFSDSFFGWIIIMFRSWTDRYCNQRYFNGDHTELCDWCFVESDQSGGSPSNFHSNTKSKRPLTNNVDGKRSNASNSLRRRRRSANAYSFKRIGDEAQKQLGGQEVWVKQICKKQDWILQEVEEGWSFCMKSYVKFTLGAETRKCDLPLFRIV